VRELEMSGERQRRILQNKVKEMQRCLHGAGIPLTNTQNVYAVIRFITFHCVHLFNYTVSC